MGIAGTPQGQATDERSRHDLDERQPSFLERCPDFVLVGTTFIILIAAWKAAIVFFKIPPFELPAPEAVAAALLSSIASADFWVNVGITFGEILAAFIGAAVLALAMGLLVTESRLAERSIMPYIVALQAVPKVALAPLLIIWFGFGVSSKIVIGGMIAFFPIFVNVVVGFRAIDARQMALVRALRANRWQIFVKLRLPTAMPYIFAGLQIAVVMASLGVIVGEFLGAKRGIGSIIVSDQYRMDVAAVFAGVVVLSAMTVLMHQVVKSVSRRVVFWTEIDEEGPL